MHKEEDYQFEKHIDRRRTDAGQMGDRENSADHVYGGNNAMPYIQWNEILVVFAVLAVTDARYRS